MKVELLWHSPLAVADIAIGKCHNKGASCDADKMRERIYRVGNKMKHGSVLEHLVYSFDIDGISRACLQELARHRIASLTAKSTRFTLKELKNENPFYPAHDYKRAEKYIVLTGNVDVDIASIHALEKLRVMLQKNISNDMAKFALPESYRTSLVWTVNARSLQNFLKLRTSKSALWEIRRLAYAIFDALPDEHKFLFEDFVEMEGTNDRKNS